MKNVLTDLGIIASIMLNIGLFIFYFLHTSQLRRYADFINHLEQKNLQQYFDLCNCRRQNEKLSQLLEEITKPRNN